MRAVLLIIYRKFLLLILFLVTAAANASEGISLCHAEATADMAKFYFPLHADDQWRWYRSETAENTPEYGWEAIVKTPSTQYVLGTYLFKFSGKKEKWGKTAEILADTQTVAARIVQQGDAAAHEIDTDIELGVEIKDNGVVINLIGKRSVDKVLGGRPKEATFNIFQPDRIDSISCVGAIVYKNEKR